MDELLEAPRRLVQVGQLLDVGLQRVLVLQLAIARLLALDQGPAQACLSTTGIQPKATKSEDIRAVATAMAKGT